MFTDALKFAFTGWVSFCCKLSYLAQLQKIAMIGSSFWLEEYTQNIVKVLPIYYLFQFYFQTHKCFARSWIIDFLWTIIATDLKRTFAIVSITDDHLAPRVWPVICPRLIFAISFNARKIYACCLHRLKETTRYYVMKRLYSGSLFSILNCYYVFTRMTSAAACCRVEWFFF